MTSQAEASFFVEGQIFNVVRMITRRSVTILTLHTFVRCTPMLLYIAFVTLETRLITPVLYRKVFPFLYVAEPVIVVRKTVTVDAEVIRDQELPGEKNQSYQCDRKPQRVQNMPLHFYLSLYQLALERLF